MSESKAVRSLIAGVLCVGVLTVMLTRHAWPLWTGEAVYLRTQPVDPRDAFRGDYVILSYPIEQLHVSRGLTSPDRDLPVRAIGDWWDGVDGPLPRGTVLYVQLEKTLGPPVGVPAEHRAVSICDRPQPGAVNLRGRVRRCHQRFGSDNDQLHLHISLGYGLDAFFLQEKTGRPIEAAIQDRGNTFAEVMVTPAGTARVKDLIIEGRRASGGQ